MTQPRVNKNTLFTYTHTLKPNLFNDFRIGYHRLDFNTLNQFSVNNEQGAGTALGIPGFDGDTKYSNPGLPSVNVSNFSGLAPRRNELVSVRHDIPGIGRPRLEPRLAQRAHRIRSAPAGDRPASGQRSARPVQLHR